ncbi:PTS transporter subunit EIIC [Escherichia coli]
MASAALTSFLTGITEPIEFSFPFIAPVLYAIHAVLAGLAWDVLTNSLGIVHGHTFSNGFIDFVVQSPRADNMLLLVEVWFGLRCDPPLRRIQLRYPCHEPENSGS